MSTLGQLKTQLRLRLGELTNGTYDEFAEYQGTFGGPETQEVDELKLLLNTAQVSVMRDIFTQQWTPFNRLDSTLPILPNQTIFTLPKDFLRETSIYHSKDNGETPILLKPRRLTKYRQIDPEREAGSANIGSYFENYEVSGQIGEILADGIVTWVDEAYQFAADDTNLSNVRVGDLVNNLTDGSQGVITNFGSGIATLGNRLYGGRSNRMQYGDEFTIQSREESRFALETWPPIAINSPALSYEIESTLNGRMIFSPTEDGVIENINVRLPTSVFLEGGVLEDYISQTRLLLYIRRIIDEDENDYEVIDIISWQDAKAGVNELDVIESEVDKGRGSIQLDRSQSYDAFIADGDQRITISSPEIFTSKSDLSFLQPPTDSLLINYTKRLAEMIIDESVCELYPELQELLVEKACLTAMRKKDPKMVNGSILQHYKILIEDGKNFLMNLQPPDAYTIDPEDIGVSTYTPGYTEYYW